jgi:hypothetical protein
MALEFYYRTRNLSPLSDRYCTVDMYAMDEWLVL